MLFGQTDDHHLTSLRCLLTELCDELYKGPRFITVIGTGSRETENQSSFFAQRHRIAFSTSEQRLAVLRIILKPLSIGDADAEAIAKRTHGFSVADLVKLKFEAFALATRQDSETITAGDFYAVVESAVCRPSLMAEYWQRLPEQRFDELVGLEDAISRLQDLVILPFQQAALSARFGIGLPRGILIHGPTGSGKTHLALALVRHAGLNYIPIAAPSIRSKYVGEAEKRLAAVFQRARECAPSVLLIDHIEALVGRRECDSSSGGSSERLITCFLTEMDGIAAKGSDSEVLVIGVTDSIHKMDPAMIRPGRLGTHIALPGTLDRLARERYLTGVTKVPLRLSEAERNLILDRTEGYSGARLRSLVEEAALDALAHDQEIVTMSNFK
jgi:transitional endoplasmic reticulum ATPase